jgi:VanZ family protein
MNRRNRVPIRALAPLVLMGLIFFFSSQQADEGVAWWEIVARKLGHVGGYALLTALWAWAFTGITRRPVVPAALIALVYACTDEYHQSFVETRNGSPVDVGVDAIGIALASYFVSRGPRAGARTRSSPVPSP